MGSVGVLGLLHSLSNDDVALAELGLDVVGSLDGSDCHLNDSNIVSVDVVRLKSNGILTLNGVLGLGVFGHLVYCDLFRIVEDDEGIKFLVSVK